MLQTRGMLLTDVMVLEKSDSYIEDDVEMFYDNSNSFMYRNVITL